MNANSIECAALSIISKSRISLSTVHLPIPRSFRLGPLVSLTDLRPWTIASELWQAVVYTNSVSDDGNQFNGHVKGKEHLGREPQGICTRLPRCE